MRKPRWIPLPASRRRRTGGARLVTYQRLIEEHLNALPGPFTATDVTIERVPTMDAWEVRALLVPPPLKEET